VLEEGKIEYEVRRIDVLKGEYRSAEFLEKSYLSDAQYLNAAFPLGMRFSRDRQVRAVSSSEYAGPPRRAELRTGGLCP
jgi:hypothetical protein